MYYPLKTISKRLFYIIMTTSIFYITACSDDPEIVIDTEIQPYLDSFLIEGEARGIEIDLSDLHLSAYISETSSDEIIGQCLHFGEEHKEIVIARAFWDDASDIEKEFIVFHELGHCILDRSHNDTTDGQGRCLSIMNSGSIRCRNLYNSDTRPVFLDELFNL